MDTTRLKVGIVTFVMVSGCGAVHRLQTKGSQGGHGASSSALAGSGTASGGDQVAAEASTQAPAQSTAVAAEAPTQAPAQSTAIGADDSTLVATFLPVLGADEVCPDRRVSSWP